LLSSEIWTLDGRQVITQLDVKADDVQQDGTLRADARVGHPGVRISFRTPAAPLMFATDEYPDWQMNVRAIALTLKALRAVDRYGIIPEAAQYAGFRASPTGTGVDESPMWTSAEAAARHLADLANRAGLSVTSEMLLDSPAQLRRAWLVVAKTVHPDVGGMTLDFQNAEAAQRRVDADQRSRGVT
jgi:hypothetical protein